MNKKELLEFLEKYAESQGFKLNPNKEIIDKILDGLLRNEEKEGDRYCPCKINHIPENVCPCLDHKKEIKETGNCKCTLFWKKD